MFSETSVKHYQVLNYNLTEDFVIEIDSREIFISEMYPSCNKLLFTVVIEVI